MALLHMRRCIPMRKRLNYITFTKLLGNSLRFSSYVNEHKDGSEELSSDDKGVSRLGKCNIELVDAETWRISSGLLEAWKGRNGNRETRKPVRGRVDGDIDDTGFNEIDDMRVQGKLLGNSSSFSLYAREHENGSEELSSDDKGVSRLGKCNIELVDAETWRISSVLVEAWKGRNGNLETRKPVRRLVDGNIDDTGFNEIDDMRVQGKLLGNSSSFSSYACEREDGSKELVSGDKRVSRLEKCNIELVDAETWQISSGLVEAWKGRNENLESFKPFRGLVDGDVSVARDRSGVDEIHDMRVQGKLLGNSSSVTWYAHEHEDGQRELISDDKGVPHLGNCKIELVDAEAWQISSGLVGVWKGRNGNLETCKPFTGRVDENIDDTGYDEIDDMRVEGKLFFKIDRDSKEYEEYSYDFHRRKKSNSKNDGKKVETKKPKEEPKETKKKQNQGSNLENMPKDVLSNYEMGDFGIEKVARTPTFNQLTAPYHEPFCLDIYVSKGSVRACIVHRATSNVVAVAHSISKDMKFDYTSKRNATTCAAVGGLLAQRALADDIHNVVYTPRKGDKVEGKLQIVLQSIIDNGVNVKVKIKQRKVRRAGSLPRR